jgi:hypothetical protein
MADRQDKITHQGRDSSPNTQSSDQTRKKRPKQSLKGRNSYLKE